MDPRNEPNRKRLGEKAIQTIHENDIKFARLQFTDIHGILKSVGVSTKNIENILVDGQSFDGSSITGYGDIEESDMVAVPDPRTFVVIPWREKELSVCRFICDIYTPAGNRYEGDPRYILQRQAEAAAELGYTYMCSPELEFFLLRENEMKTERVPFDLRGYFDYDPLGENEQIRRTIADTAEKFGVEIEVMHHEVAHGQNEIDIKYCEVQEQADNALSMKMVIKSIAAQMGYVATFMPKPFHGVNGSGMHVHQSLWRGDVNAFYDEDDSDHISETMKHFIGGQIAHGREICAVLNSWPNSFKRLVPGFEAPVYLAWGFKNRSPLIRVPNFGGKMKGARCEIRCPDPAGNPYLQFAVLLAAGIDGIKNKTEPPVARDENVYKLSYKERKKLNIVSLPESLSQALDEFEKSALMREVFPENAFKNFLYAKHDENDAYRTSVSEWEFKRYAEKL
ncbi:MAG: type I glutamate--ammonia ligase [Promethearchaeota archaeon]